MRWRNRKKNEFSGKDRPLEEKVLENSEIWTEEFTGNSRILQQEFRWNFSILEGKVVSNVPLLQNQINKNRTHGKKCWQKSKENNSRKSYGLQQIFWKILRFEKYFGETIIDILKANWCTTTSMAKWWNWK